MYKQVKHLLVSKCCTLSQFNTSGNIWLELEVGLKVQIGNSSFDERYRQI
jgi:hypothetical protein